MENQLAFGEKCAESLLAGGERVGGWLADGDDSDWERGDGLEADGVVLRELHALLREKDRACGFGGLVRVQNKRREFLWVDKRFAGEY